MESSTTASGAAAMNNSMGLAIGEFRLGIYTDDYSQPYSFFRVAGPFERMSRTDRRLKIVYPLRDAHNGQVISWDWLLRCDAIFLHHPLSDLHVNCLALAKMMGVPTWIEFTDDPFSVRASNPNSATFNRNRKLVRENITSCIDLADVVTVTSPCLKGVLLAGTCTTREAGEELLKRTAAKILVLPEACCWPPAEMPRRKCVSWRGLGTHDEDVMSVAEQWCAVAKDFPDWEWVLFGEPSTDLVEMLQKAAGDERVLVSPFWPTPFHMMEAWRNKAPYLHLTPLAENPFNLSKSCLAWLEASAVGAGIIVPDYLPEWQQPGVIPYSGWVIAHNGKQDFGTVLRRELLAYEEGKMHPNVAVARAEIYPKWTPAAQNAKRWAVLRKLAGWMEGGDTAEHAEA